jgi:hypothetical protein
MPGPAEKKNAATGAALLAVWKMATLAAGAIRDRNRQGKDLPP